MNEVTLPPSPNWYLSSILDCANDGTVAWGAKNNIVIAKTKDNSKTLDYSIIEKAHAERVTTIAFSTNQQDGNYCLVSGGDDNIVNIWNLKVPSLQTKNMALDKKHKVIGVDWSKLNSNLICYISEDGVLVTWNVSYNATQIITFGKLTATCLACCPHDENIVAIGSKSGLVYIIDVCGNGTIKYKLRGHDVDIVSLSWCPVPINIFQNEKPKEFMLASGAKDRNIFLWKAGTDGRYQTQITFPPVPLDTNSHKSRVSASAGNFTAVCWLEPTILLSSSPWGELLVWNLSGNAKKKFTPTLVHAKHGRGLFSIVGLAQNSIEQIENTENENWRSKLNIKAIWTLSQDRQVICCSLTESETKIEYSIPTQGGFVYCMSACPVDTSQIAFGVGDAMIRLWNLSEPHESVMEVQSLWEKIKGKVRSLSWHPEKENLLAFATNEGRVGVYDTHSKKPPILYRQYHRNVVYRIGWGPAPNVKEYALFSCGDGEVVYYDPEKFNTNPVAVTKNKNCTEFCWKPDYSILAIGFGDGSISFFNRDLKEYGHMIHTLNKAVQCLSWHPESTSSDLNISTMQNYLAVATMSTMISVFDISDYNQSKENVSEESSLYKTIANLNAHGDKVVCLAWSPHVSGYLVSGSYDYTAQVWKVESQEIIATYTSHLGPLQCCMWSPFDQDLIITGATDFTLRIWSISNQKILTSPPSTKTSTKSKRTKKKKTKETVDDHDDTVINPKLVANGLDVTEEKNQPSSKVERTMTNTNKSLKKKKKPTHFPGYAEVVNDNKLWISTVRNLLASLGKNDQTDGSEICKSNGIEVDEPGKSSEELSTIFGNKENLKKALIHEKSILESNEQHSIVTEIDVWSGNLEENLERASQQNRLNDFFVSLAPNVSMQFWEKMCKAYAQQLIFEENPHKAATYYLCVQDVQKALSIFKMAKLYKEAYVLAVSRLASDDVEISSILEEWAAFAEYNGHYQNATECYIKLGEYEKAAKILARRKDIDSYILAIDLAKIVENVDLITSLADEAIIQGLLNSNIKSTKIVLEKCPSIQYRDVEIEVFSELNTLIKNADNIMIIEWLKGSTATALLETLCNRFPKCSKTYSMLLQKDIPPMPVNRKVIQLNASHQLALYVLSDEPKKQLQHIVKALHIIVQHENSLEVPEDGIPILIKYLYILGSIKSDSNSIFNSNEFNISKSLRAYLCYGVINWYLEHKLDPERMSQCTDLVLAILEAYVEDLLDKESIKYWTTTNEITKLETLLSSDSLQSETIGDDPVENKKKSAERLDQLRNEKKQFLEERISSPNPLFSYGAVMEFISKISNEEAQKKISEHVTNTWRAAIS